MRKISMSLDVSSIEAAISELRQYARELENKAKILRQRIGERIAWSASDGFSTNISDDIVNGEKQYGDVEVSVDEGNDVTVVVADGNDAIFMEFGAGVFNNGAVGTTPHPDSLVTYTIGSYSKKNPNKTVWGYYDGGELVLTHGTPASMPMYRGMKDAIEVVDSIAREVFGS